MKIYNLILIFATISLMSCGSDTTSSNDSVEADTITMDKVGGMDKSDKQQKIDEIEENKALNSDPNYIPSIINLDVGLKGGKYESKESVRGRDANYHNAYAKENTTYSVTLESENPDLNLKILAPEGVVYDADMQGGKVSWKGTFQESGLVTYHVSIATDASHDKNIAEYIIKIEEQ